MSATEDLRRMLDERGVEYEGGERSVRWRDHNGVMMQAFPLANGELGMDVWSCTPEQAIAATLGAGTCKPREVRSRFSRTQERVTYYCECGHELGGYMTAELPFPHRYNEDRLPNYCPNCGRRVVDE